MNRGFMQVLAWMLGAAAAVMLALLLLSITQH